MSLEILLSFSEIKNEFRNYFSRQEDISIFSIFFTRNTPPPVSGKLYMIKDVKSVVILYMSKVLQYVRTP